MSVPTDRRLKAAGAVALLGAGMWLIRAVATLERGENAFMPHGFCYLGNTRIAWLNVISDGLIALSYYCIPLILVYFIRKNQGIPFNRIFWLFGGFILACGSTHALEVWNVWHGNYLLAGVVKALTAAVSVLTAVMLIPLIPEVISLPSRVHLGERNRKLEREVAEPEAREARIEAPLRNRVAVGFVVTIAVAGLMGFLIWRGAQQVAIESEWVAHTQIVLTCLESTLRHVLDVETGARGFALVGEEQFLQPYAAGQRELIQDLNELQRLTADNPAQHRRLEGLEPRIAAAVRLTQTMVATRKQTKAPPGPAMLFENKKSVDAVRGSIQEMQDAENQLLVQRGQASREARQRANLIATGGMMLGSLILAAAGFLVNREIGVSAAARAQIARLNATLEERVERRTAALNSEIAERKRAEARNVQLAAIVESSADAIFSKDLSGVVLSWNPGAERMFGYSEAEAVGKPLMIVPPDRNEELDKLDLEIMQGRQIARDGTTRRRKDGTLLEVSLIMSPLRDGSGRVTGASVIARDITERRRAEVVRERLAAVVDCSEDAIIGKDLNSLITAWNRGAEKVFGYSAEEMMGKSMRKLFPPERAEEETEIMSRIRRGESVEHYETVRVRKDGSRIDVSVTISPIKDRSGTSVGVSKIARDISESKQTEARLARHAEQLARQTQELDVSRGVVAFRDISQRKADEQEIRRLNDNLERKVAERTAQLEVANQELEAFSYSVSHDLRAPLRHIIGFSQILREEFGPKLDPNAHRYLDRIQAGTQKMGLLVDELLNLARVGRHELNRQPTRLTAMVEEVAAILEPETTGRQVEWVLDELPEVTCDPVLIKQVFQNLMANALKFTRPLGDAGSGMVSEAARSKGSGGRAVIRVSCREENGQQVFVVRDNGIGFDMKYVDKLFGVFQRLHRAEEFEGTGIGLATVQRIVHKHGGRVWAEGEVGKGATFSFTLSAAEQAKPKNNAAGAGGRA